ncbi:MAG TPA: DUF3857 domain-containing protein [Flavisolibacter sp.]|nr:DUF3857 domain-containing protein [Flavisolibacter sp.]
MPDKNAYLYALWFNESLLGPYSKKDESQLNFLNQVLNDKSFNPSIRSAAHYMKGMHFVFSNDFVKASQEWVQTGGIQDWQLVGPFENISGSGFNNQYGPLASTSAETRFKGINSIDVGWFTPSKMNKEGWIMTYPNLPYSSAIVYAQTFVYSPEDRKVMLNAGVCGTLKVWVNDGLVLSESKERVTEIDYYKNYCQLKKGYNRVLVQLGYTSNVTSNFFIRFSDEAGETLKDLTVTSKVQPYSASKETQPAHSLKHFAEVYFEERIKNEPANLINYILLSQTYLRNQRVTEARQVTEKALLQAPENPLLRFELMQCLLKAENKTLLSRELQWLKENDAESYVNLQIQINNLIEEEKYAEAMEELNKMSRLYGEDLNVLHTRAKLLGKLEKLDELVDLVQKNSIKYPTDISFLSMTYNIQKLVKKDSKAAFSVYEKYLRNNYNYEVIDYLASEYKDQGASDKYLSVLKVLYDQASYDPRFVNRLLQFYSEKRNYAKALEYAMESLALSPYDGSNWANLATIQEAMNKTEEAIGSYKKAIYLDRTNYDARKKLNALEKKADLYKLLPETDVYALIKSAKINTEFDYNYLLDEKGTVIFEEGASEEYTTYVVKLNTQKGIDTWKELYLPYNSNTQSLLVEKSEVIKANGSRQNAERNDNQVVFTGLEPGDAIYVKFRVQNYASGRLGREFADKFTFNSFVPSATARYTMIAPKGFQFNSRVANSTLQPVLKEQDGLVIYTWEQKNIQPLKSEPLMPNLNDVGTVLHISTIKSWQEVANWYSDVAYQQMTDNFELDALYKEIFPDNTKMTDLEKARKIYNYIVTNIRYSSISFRQSGYVPQDVSKIITTRLGDCKDLSTLFAALANKAGIETQLVLIDTRDNGAKDILLPSMEFNHCIALAKINGKEYYIELTDSNLPFGSLPNNLTGALSLKIPAHGQKAIHELEPLYSTTRTPDRIIRYVDVSIIGKDEKLKIRANRTGSLTSTWRDGYATLSAEKQKDEFEQSISNGYKNPVKLENVTFKGLNELSDSLLTDYSYTIKNEVIEAGSMHMIKVPFIDVVATLESLTLDSRQFPIEYWNYENTDAYETVVTIKFPEGQKLLEVPTDLNLSFRKSSYSVKYVKEGNLLKVYRKAILQRENITPEEYDKFKAFFNAIVEAESKYVVFK